MTNRPFGKSPVIIISMLVGTLIGFLAGIGRDEQSTLVLVGLVVGLAIGTLVHSRTRA